MAIELKYRPKKLESIIGNEDIVNQLKVTFQDKKPTKHTIMLEGPKGCGKTTIARILCKLAKCKEINEMDIAASGGKERALELIERVNAMSIFGGNKAYIMDEVHMGTTAFFNALLKNLEEPPSHVFYFLCTTEPNKVLGTVTSRCARYIVESLTPNEISKLLHRVIKKEKANVLPEVIKRISNSGNGIPRDSLIMLEKVMWLPTSKQKQASKELVERESNIKELCTALLQKKSWKAVAEILRSIKDINEETIRRSVLGYMNAILVNGKDDIDIYTIMDNFKEPFYNSGRAGLTLACYESVAE